MIKKNNSRRFHGSKMKDILRFDFWYEFVKGEHGWISQRNHTVTTNSVSVSGNALMSSANHHSGTDEKKRDREREAPMLMQYSTHANEKEKTFSDPSVQNGSSSLKPCRTLASPSQHAHRHQTLTTRDKPGPWI